MPARSECLVDAYHARGVYGTCKNQNPIEPEKGIMTMQSISPPTIDGGRNGSPIHAWCCFISFYGGQCQSINNLSRERVTASSPQLVKCLHIGNALPQDSRYAG